MKKLLGIIEEKGFAVLVSPPRNDEGLARAAFDGGADAIKVHLNVHHKASGNRFGPWDEEEPVIRRILDQAGGPVGLMPGAESTATPAEMEKVIAAGIDFIDIYDFHMPSWMLNLALCKMVAVGEHYTLEGVMALESLGMDLLEASIVPHTAYGTSLTVRDLENYASIAAMIRCPVVVPSQKRIEPEDLPLLRKAGVRAVLLGTISLGDTKESFAERLPKYVEAV